MTTICDSNFEEIITNNRLVLIKFGNKFCHACHSMDKALNELEKKIKDNKIIFGNVSFDANPELSEKFDCEIIPLLVLFKNGIEVARSEGAKSPDQIKDFVRSNLKK